MARKGFCPHCRSVQPLGEYQDEGQSGLWCETCRNPLEGSYVEKPTARSRPLTILCIDDDRIVLSFCSDALERHGFRTLIASDGSAGIETAKRNRPDLILLDVMMPGMTGMELHERVKTAAPSQADRFVFVTGGAFTEAARQFLETSAAPRLDKPFDPQHLREVVDEVARRAPGPPRG